MAQSINYSELVRPDAAHGGVYTDPDIFRDELTRIFSKTWVYIGHESEIPDKGDFKRRAIGIQPVIFCRDGSGKIQVLFNRCRHRAATVCQEDCGNVTIPSAQCGAIGLKSCRLAMSDHSAELYQPVASFLNAEARLMDGNEYSEWLDLFATECLYWIPSNHEDADPSKHVSILYCDRAMLENHVRRLVEGKAFAQSPRSRTSRIVSNIDVSESATGISASANFLITELRGHVQHLHAGRSEYKLRKIDSGFLIQQKKVVLLGLDEPQDNVTFLL